MRNVGFEEDWHQFGADTSGNTNSHASYAMYDYNAASHSALMNSTSVMVSDYPVARPTGVLQSVSSNSVPQFGRSSDVVPAGRVRTRAAAKRALDIAASAAGILVLSPVLIGIAIAVKATSRGPVLFRQPRVGYRNSTFDIFKFRSMYTDRCDLTGVAQTTENDPRITPVGRFLRRTSLDELPQLLNVLRGDMSLVGPRPHVAGMLACGVPYEELAPDYDRRHDVRPGITGLAQVNGYRGPTTTRDAALGRVRYDIQYVENYSFWGDVKIILKTVANEFKGGSGL